MLDLEFSAFDADSYLTSAGPGRCVVEFGARKTFFSQGEAADSVFFLQSGRARRTIVAKNGSEATISFLAAGEFVGEESLTSARALYTSTATSVTDCKVLKIERAELLRAMHEEHSLSERFTRFLVERGVRIQADLVAQLFNSSERRLAKMLLLMAETGRSGEFEGLLPELTKETLAQVIGTSPAEINFFLHRFSELGLIAYDGRIRVYPALLKTVLYDQLPGDNTLKPASPYRSRRSSKSPEDPELALREMN